MLILHRKRTIFSTPVIAGFFRQLAWFFLWLGGWKIEGNMPQQKRFVLVGAPHTSNWDFILMLLAVFIWRIEVRWMGKDSIFKPPFAGLMIWLGGISIDRSKAHNTVEQMVEHYRQQDELVVLIPPEGTRSKVERWKTGFYHIAVQAEVPIVLGYIDASTKTVGLGPLFSPTGNIESDLPAIQQFYKDKQAIKPHLF